VEQNKRAALKRPLAAHRRAGEPGPGSQGSAAGAPHARPYPQRQQTLCFLVPIPPKSLGEGMDNKWDITQAKEILLMTPNWEEW